MIKKYIINYNDGVYYGTITFFNKSRKFIKRELAAEIKDNNQGLNKLYHIGFKNIKRVWS